MKTDASMSVANMIVGLSMLTAAVFYSELAAAQTANDLVGTWQHVANVNISADGKRTDTFGANPAGMAIFSSDGHFMVINLRREIPKFASNSRAQGTPEENKAVVQGSIALYGTYSVADKVITMKIDDSTFPNWRGTKQTRDIVSFNRDEITWRLSASIGGQAEVTWKRIK